MKLTKPISTCSCEMSDSFCVEYVGEIKPMTDAEKVEHLENWIKSVINECVEPTGNLIIDRSKILSIRYGLQQSLKYDNRDIVVRWYP